jgi:phosphohistidine swiveling domain-containing protein
VTRSNEWVLGDRLDPLNQPCTTPVRWTTVNIAEAFPGVPTLLTWTVIGPAIEGMTRGGYILIGAIPLAERELPAAVQDRFLGIFHGRPAFNVDAFRATGDAIPGTSGDAVETLIFGGKKTSATSSALWRRYPIVAVKLPIAALRSRPAMDRLGAATETWWRESTSSTRSRPALIALLHEAQRRIIQIGPHHTVLSMLAVGAYEQCRNLCRSAGCDGLETSLLGTDGEEGKTVADLWAVSRDRMTIETFLHAHGFHGPAEGELSKPSWREDPAALHALIDTYRRLDDTASPATGQRTRLTDRDDAEATLIAALSPVRRRASRGVLAIARYYLRYREIGRGTFLKAIDVARFAACRIGEDLATAGLLDEPDDVFFLCLDELDPLPGDVAQLVAARRAAHNRYSRTELPDLWTGTTEPTPIKTVDDHPSLDDEPVSGLGVSGGIVEGNVRVILELGDDDLEPEEILVCRTTDPGWASYFFVAGGVVIDIGGPVSHGAIVARELGIPCVINTRDGSQRLRTGDMVRIDGTSGTVTVLAPVPQP